MPPLAPAHCRCFLRDAISSGGQRWQWRHSRPFWQPPGLQYHAHGLHVPAACGAEPTEGWHTAGPAGAEAAFSTAIGAAGAAEAVLSTVIGSSSRPGGGRSGTGNDRAGPIMGESSPAARWPGPGRDRTRAIGGAARGPGAGTDCAVAITRGRGNAGSAAAEKLPGGAHGAAAGARALATIAWRGGLSSIRLRILLRSTISPSGHSWQWRHSCPF